jgi:endonuclease III
MIERSFNMSISQITQILLDKGNQLLIKPRELIGFTGNFQADNFLNDLENNPHAFVLACIMDRRIKAERAWLIPYLISSQINGFTFTKLASLEIDDVKKIFDNSDKPIHRYPAIMADCFYFGIKRISDEYNGDASKIWSGHLSSAEVVYRFLQFKGVGPKIATMTVNILARDFKIKFSDYYSVDISVDIHVKRIFKRLGLVPNNATNEEIIYRARAISPEYPGLLDLPLWEISRKYCKSQNPMCLDCYLEKYCLKIIL